MERLTCPEEETFFRDLGRKRAWPVPIGVAALFDMVKRHSSGCVRSDLYVPRGVYGGTGLQIPGCPTLGGYPGGVSPLRSRPCLEA
jgi:hypothetical protein